MNRLDPNPQPLLSSTLTVVVSWHFICTYVATHLSLVDSHPAPAHATYYCRAMVKCWTLVYKVGLSSTEWPLPSITSPDKLDTKLTCPFNTDFSLHITFPGFFSECWVKSYCCPIALRRSSPIIKVHMGGVIRPHQRRQHCCRK